MIKKDDVNILTSTYEVIDFILGENYQSVELDLGCGNGGFALQLAERYPDRLILAADIKLRRLRKIVKKANKRNLTNIITLRTDAWELIGMLLPPNCIDRMHILNPDPWPKARHRWHRLITSEFLGRTARIFKKNAILHLSTDDPPYFEIMKEAIKNLKAFHEDQKLIADIEDIKTDFELQYLAENKPVNHKAYSID